MFRLVFLILSVGSLYAFPPSDLGELQDNSERLLASQQYTYLAEYFSSYWKPYASEPKLGTWLADFCERIPRFETRQKILASISSASNTGFNRSRFHYEYALGLFLDGKSKESAAALAKSKDPAKAFLEGEIQWELKNTSAAESGYNKYLKLSAEFTTLEFRNRSYLRLTEIALFKNDLIAAKNNLRSVDGESVDKEMFRYRIALASGAEAEKSAALKKLERDYAASVKAQTFLASLVK